MSGQDINSSPLNDPMDSNSNSVSEPYSQTSDPSIPFQPRATLDSLQVLEKQMYKAAEQASMVPVTEPKARFSGTFSSGNHLGRQMAVMTQVGDIIRRLKKENKTLSHVQTEKIQSLESDLKSKNRKLRDVIESLRIENEKKDRIANQLDEEMVQLKQQLKHLKAAKSTTTARGQSSSGFGDKKTIDKVLNVAKMMSEDIVELRREWKEKERHASRSDLASLKRKLEDKQKGKRDMFKLIQRMEKVKASKADKSGINQEVAQLKETLKQMEKDARDHEEHIRRLEDENATTVRTEEEVKRTKKQLLEREQDLKRSSEMIRQLEDVNQRLLNMQPSSDSHDMMKINDYMERTKEEVKEMIESLQMDNETKDHIVQQLISNEDRLHHEIAELKKQLREKEQDAASENDIANQRGMLGHKEAARRQTLDNIRRLADGDRKAKENKEALSEMIESLTMDNVAKDRMLQQHIANEDLANRNIAELRNQLEQKEQELEGQNEAKDKMLHQYIVNEERLNDDADEMRRLLEEKEREVRAAKSENKMLLSSSASEVQLKRQIAELREKEERLNEDADEMRRLLEEKEREVMDTKYENKMLLNSSASEDHLKQQITALRERIGGLEGQNKAKDKILLKHIANEERFTLDITGLRKQLEQKEQQVRATMSDDETVSHRNQQVAELREMIHELGGQINAKDGKIRALQEEIQVLGQAAQSGAKDWEKCMGTVQQLHAENKRRISQIRNLTAEKEAAQMRIQMDKKEIQELNEMQSNRKSRTPEIESLKEEIAHLKEELANTIAEDNALAAASPRQSVSFMDHQNEAQNMELVHRLEAAEAEKESLIAHADELARLLEGKEREVRAFKLEKIMQNSSVSEDHPNQQIDNLRETIRGLEGLNKAKDNMLQQHIAKEESMSRDIVELSKQLEEKEQEVRAAVLGNEMLPHLNQQISELQETIRGLEGQNKAKDQMLQQHIANEERLHHDANALSRSLQQIADLKTAIARSKETERALKADIEKMQSGKKEIEAKYDAEKTSNLKEMTALREAKEHELQRRIATENRLNDDLVRLEKEVKACKSENKSKNNQQIVMLQGRIRKLGDENQRFEQKEKEDSKRIDEMIQIIESLKADNEEKDKTLKQQLNLKEEEQQISLTRLEEHDRNSTNTLKQEALKAARAQEREAMYDMIESLKKDNETKDRTLQQLLDSDDHIRREIEDIRGNLQTREKEVRQARYSIERLENERMKMINTQKQEDIHKMAHKPSLEQRIIALQSELSSLQAALDKKDMEYQEQQRSLDDTSNTLQIAVGEKDELESRNKELDTSVNTLKKQEKELNAEIEKLRREKDDALKEQHTHDEHVKRIADLETEIDLSKKAERALEVNIEKLQNEKKDVEAKYDAQVASNRDKMQEIEDLMVENRRLTESEQRIENSLENERRNCNEMIATLRKDIEAKECQLQRQMDSENRLNHDLERLKKRFQQLHDAQIQMEHEKDSKICELKNHKAAMECELNRTIEKCKSLKHEADGLKREMDRRSTSFQNELDGWKKEMRQQTDCLKEKLCQKDEELRDTVSRIRGLEEETQENMRLLDDRMHYEQDQKQAILCLQESKKVLQCELKSIHVTLEKREAECQKRQSALNDKIRDYRSLQSQMQGLTLRNQKLESSNQDLKTQVMAQKTQIENVQREKKDILYQQNQKHTYAIEDLKRENQHLIQSEKRMKEVLENERRVLNDKIESLNDEMANAAREYEDNVSRLNHRIQELRNNQSQYEQYRQNANDVAKFKVKEMNRKISDHFRNMHCALDDGAVNLDQRKCRVMSVVEDKEAEIENLRKERDDGILRIQEMENIICCRNQEIENLKGEIHRLLVSEKQTAELLDDERKNSEDVAERQRQCMATAERLDGEVAQLKEDFREKEKELQDKDEKIQELEEEHGRLVDEHKNCNRDRFSLLNEAEVEFAKTIQKLEDAERENEEKLQEIENLKAENVLVMKSLADKTKEVRQLASAMDDRADDDTDQLRDKLNDKNKELQDCMETIRRLEEENGRLYAHNKRTSNMDGVDSDIGKLRKERDDAKYAIQQLEEENSRLKSEKQSSEDAVSLQQKLNGKEEELKHRMEMIYRLQDENLKLQGEMRENADSAPALKDRDQQIANLESSSKALQMELNRKNEECKTLQSVLKGLEQQKCTFFSAVNSLEKAVAKVRAERDDAKVTICIMEKKIRKLIQSCTMREIEKLRAENRRLSVVVSRGESPNNASKKRLKQQLARLEETLNGKSMDAKQMAAMIQRLLEGIQGANEESPKVKCSSGAMMLHEAHLSVSKRRQGETCCNFEKDALNRQKQFRPCNDSGQHVIHCNTSSVECLTRELEQSRATVKHKEIEAEHMTSMIHRLQQENQSFGSEYQSLRHEHQVLKQKYRDSVEFASKTLRNCPC